MSTLTSSRHATLVALVDALHPATDGLPSASGLGVVDALEVALADVDWNGERWYDAAPHEQAPHAGHGWQGDGTPAELFGIALDRIAPVLAGATPEDVLTEAAADALDLGVIASSDLVRLLQRHVLVAATGATLR